MFNIFNWIFGFYTPVFHCRASNFNSLNMKVLIFITVVTLMVILPFAESNPIHENKPYCILNEIQDIMTQVCGNEHQYRNPKPNSLKKYAESIRKRCCNNIGCSATELRTYCIREEKRVETDFPSFVNKNDSALAKTVLDELDPVVTTSMPVTTYQNFGFSKFAFGRQHYPGSQ